jgi:hypothetical protein
VKGPQQGSGPKLPRVRTFFERTWPWLAITVVAGAASAAGTAAALRRFQRTPDRSGSSAFLLDFVLGGVAFVLLLSVALYWIRKRTRVAQERSPGSMMAWLRAHVWLGLLALVVTAIHASVRPYTSVWTTGKVSALILAALVLSGVLWRVVYAGLPKIVARRVGNLAIEDTERRLGEVRQEFEKLAAGRSQAFGSAIEGLARGGRWTPDPAVAEPFDAEETAAWAEGRELSERAARYRVRLRRQRRYSRVLQGWKLVHLPLAAALFGALAVHAMGVFNTGPLPNRVVAQGFPSVSECAACHSDIANEWQASMLAHSQLSPIDIAQTAAALRNDKNHEFMGFCVDCHAPVGTQLSAGTTFPLQGADSPVANEGVSCVACHSLHEHPPIGSGASPGFPITLAGRAQLATVDGPFTITVPVTDHNATSDVLAAEQAASTLCGACHVVAKDLNDDGDAMGPEDLQLQNTYNEWLEAYQAGEVRDTCIGCHMVPESLGKIADFAPFGMSLPERFVHAHTFVGVDYDLAPGAYTQAELAGVLKERARLLQTAAKIAVGPPTFKGGVLSVDVTVTNLSGHFLPTGFAFVRQMWLQVRANKLDDGQGVCLRDIAGIKAKCRSGFTTAQEDLDTCSPLEVGLARFEPIVLAFTTAATPSSSNRGASCDPWLANFQKILTDGTLDSAELFHEVPYQSPLPGIVKDQFRIFDHQDMEAIPVGGSTTIHYEFDHTTDGQALTGKRVEVDAALLFRHLPPYFIREPALGFSDQMQQQLIEGLAGSVVKIAKSSSEPFTVP